MLKKEIRKWSVGGDGGTDPKSPCVVYSRSLVREPVSCQLMDSIYVG